MSKATLYRSNLRRLVWPAIAIVSLLGNALVLGMVIYLTHYNQFPLYQTAVSKMCTEPGYSQIMKNLEEAGTTNVEANKKFAAAAICFTDYATGKPLDIDSLKPAPTSTANLPARP